MLPPQPQYYNYSQPPIQPTISAPPVSEPSPSPPKLDIEYTSIDYFLDQLHPRQLHRDLQRYTVVFRENDYYNIDEIARMGKNDLIKVIGMSSGNAEFILGEVTKEMKRIDREEGRAKRVRLDNAY